MSSRRAPHRFLLLVVASLMVSAFTATSAGAASPPLSAGQLQHTFEVSFAPKVAPVKGIPFSAPDFSTVPTTFETWYASNGAGRTIGSVGAYSHRYAPIVRRDSTGAIIGLGSNSSLQPGTSRFLSMVLANTVSTFRRPEARGDRRSRNWVRQAGGYELIKGRFAPAGFGGPEFVWGASYAQLAALPDSGPELDAAMGRLIEDVPTQLWELPTGAWGETVATMRTEQQLRRALLLLKRAPLSRNDRLAVLRWIQRQEFATTVTDSADHVGRPGTRIRVTRVFDEQVPARTVSAKQLVEEARAAGARDLPDTTSTESWTVAAHREHRRYLLELTYDSPSGRLLDSWVFSSKYYAVDMPQVSLVPKNGDRGAFLSFRVVQGPSASQSDLEANLTYANETVSRIVPRTPVCARQPKLCR